MCVCPFCVFTLGMDEFTYVEYLSRLNPVRLIVGQTIASFSESALLHSFELMTTRLQVAGDYRLSAIRAEVGRVHSDGGVRSFYRGYGITAAMNVPIELLYRTTYDYNCRTMGHSPFLAGFFADTLISVFQVPAEVISQRLQIAPRNTPAREIVRHLWKTERLWGFYKTLNIAIMIHPFQAGAWWYFYEITKKHTTGNIFISSCAASVLVSAMFNPVLVVKTQLQTGTSKLSGPKLFFQFVKTKPGRLALLTAGLVPSMMRSVFEGFIHAFSYETVFKYAKQ